MSFWSLLFGGGAQAVGNTVTQVAGAFRPNAENEAQRAADARTAAMGQLAAEFGAPGGGIIRSVANGLNSLVRPLLVLLIFWPIIETRTDPETAAKTWAALAIVPESYWWLVGAVVTFYFGGRMQVKSLSAKTMQAAAQAAAALAVSPSEATDDDLPETGDAAPRAAEGHDGYGPNAALAEMQGAG